jgi:hypothetical protein
VGGGGALEPWASSDFRESSGRIPSSPQNSESHLPGILGKSGILTASFDVSHVTQPRARINVSCSRAGQKGAKGGGAGEPREGGGSPPGMGQGATP